MTKILFYYYMYYHSTVFGDNSKSYCKSNLIKMKHFDWSKSISSYLFQNFLSSSNISLPVEIKTDLKTQYAALNAHALHATTPIIVQSLTTASSENKHFRKNTWKNIMFLPHFLTLRIWQEHAEKGQSQRETGRGDSSSWARWCSFPSAKNLYILLLKKDMRERDRETCISIWQISH